MAAAAALLLGLAVAVGLVARRLQGPAVKALPRHVHEGKAGGQRAAGRMNKPNKPSGESPRETGDQTQREGNTQRDSNTQRDGNKTQRVGNKTQRDDANG